MTFEDLLLVAIIHCVCGINILVPCACPCIVKIFDCLIPNTFEFYCIAVCTCVVHKRCHQSVVTKCPGMKDATQDEVSNRWVRYLVYIVRFEKIFLI
jgi:hypothetical protein